MRQKIGILYICTGKYDIFWKEFYKSCEKYFLPGYTKEYFVFTDTKNLYNEEAPNINKIYQAKLQFPLDTLMRFDMFLSIEEQLQQIDYLYFLNANIVFVKKIIDEEVFPTEEENGLIGYQHAAFYDKLPNEFIYERNPKSTAFVEPGKGNCYYQGCFIGGKLENFLAMCKILDKSIKEDLKNNFIAIWWDESHINHYLLYKKVKLLHPGYAYPELWNLPFEKKAIMLDKSKRMALDILRGIKKPDLMDKVKLFIKKVTVKVKY